MKAFLSSLLAACLLFLSPGFGAAETAAGAGSASDRLLALVAAGYFEEADLSDALTGRVFSAVYPQLCTVTGEDRARFAAAVSANEKDVDTQYYRALARCLQARIQWEPTDDTVTHTVNTVLLLFLDPEAIPDAESQKQQILENMSEPVFDRLTETSLAPRDFMEWLIYGTTARTEP